VELHLSEPGPDHAAGARPIVDELERISRLPVVEGQDLAEVASRLALLAYSLHARMDRLQTIERLWGLVAVLGVLGWIVAGVALAYR
jgi:hypothetical protein